MTANQTTQGFPSHAKKALKTSHEINENGLVWRKLSDTSGVWRFDFRANGRRYQGVIGKERDGVTLSEARRKLKEHRAKSYLESADANKSKDVCGNRGFEAVAIEYLEWAKVNRRGYRLRMLFLLLSVCTIYHTYTKYIHRSRIYTLIHLIFLQCDWCND